MPPDLRPPDARKSLGMTLNEVQKRFPEGVPLLDPVDDMVCVCVCVLFCACMCVYIYIYIYIVCIYFIYVGVCIYIYI